MIPIPLPTQSRRGRFGEDGSERLVNAVIEPIDGGIAIYSRPGLDAYASLDATASGIRALVVVDNQLYAVAERHVYSVDTSAGSAQLTGGIAADGPVYHATNMSSIPMTAFVAGGVVTVLQGGTLSELSDEDLPPPVDVTFLSGYFIYAGRKQFYWSAINDSDVDALDFASNEGAPDDTRRVVTFRNELWFFGERTVEVWGLSGDADAPFQRLGGGAINIGIGAAGSVGQIQQDLLWIADDFTVRRANGYSGVRVSTHDVERSIRAVDQTTITAATFNLHGHSYYLISSASWTWVYDLASGKWSEWQTYQSGRLDVSCFVEFAGEIIAGSASSGSLFKVNADAYEDDGADLVWTVQTALPKSFPARQRINAIFADLIAGRGLIDGDDEDTGPEVMLRISRDGGNTWGGDQRRSLGRIGERGKRVAFRRLGLGRPLGTQIEISVSAAVGRGLLGLAVDVDLASP